MLSLIFDFETTGLDTHADRICEMAFILTDWKEIYAITSTYVNPEISFDNAYNKINSAIVADAPTFGSLLPFTFLLLLRTDEYVAHNAKFDLGFMREELARYGLQVPRRSIYDTLRAAHGLKLEDACVRAGVHTLDIEWHSALGDATACYRLARVLRADRQGRVEQEASMVPRFS